MLIIANGCSKGVFRNEHRVMRESLPRVSPQVCSVALLRLSRSQRVGRRGSTLALRLDRAQYYTILSSCTSWEECFKIMFN